MDALKAYPNARLTWHDAGKTILMLEVLGTWTWGDAYQIVDDVLAATHSQPHDVCVVVLLHQSTFSLPGGMEMNHLSNLMAQARPNNRLVIFVGGPPLLQKVLAAVSRFYRLTGIFSRYRFVATLDDALALIARDRSERP